MSIEHLDLLLQIHGSRGSGLCLERRSQGGEGGGILAERELAFSEPDECLGGWGGGLESGCGLAVGEGGAEAFERHQGGCSVVEICRLGWV
jgi:hypothetical protein